MADDLVVTDPNALYSSVVGQEHPIAYRLIRRAGELVLQGLWRETVTTQSREVWSYYRRDEWRDIPTVEESGDAGG